MENKWVTLAVRTYQRSQMIKNVLDENGIETLIHNLNVENPEVAVGVRVRIQERDLPKALCIVEEVEKAWDEEEKKRKGEDKNMVLIPIELTDEIEHVCKFGFRMAELLKTEVVFLHAYLPTTFTITPNATTEFSTYSIPNSETLRRNVRNQKADVENLNKLVYELVADGKLADVTYRFVLKEGVPEDVIYEYAKKHKPSLVVMGSDDYDDENEIGSVTSEILETSRVPVIAISKKRDTNPDSIKRIAFFTSFDQSDLLAIDNTIALLAKDDLQITFVHSTDSRDTWDEVMLAGIKVYFANQYPQLKTDYALLTSSKDVDGLRKFLVEKEIDMLALNRRKRNLISRLFSHRFATRLLFNVDTPLLVLRK